MNRTQTSPLAHLLRTLCARHLTLGLPALFDRMEGRA
jgi:hypothetical protein